jgi:hypothetical protein
MKMSIPFILSICVIAVSAIKELRTKAHFHRGSHNWKQFFYAQGVSLLLLTVGTLYTFLFVAVVSPFRCIKSDTYYVFLDLPGVKCFDDVWYSWLPLVLFFMLLYGIALPGILIFLLYKNKNNIQAESFQLHFGGFIKPFKDEYFWWGLVFVFKRTLFGLTGALMKLRNVELLSLFVTLLILCVFIWTEIRFLPFQENSKMHLSAA